MRAWIVKGTGALVSAIVALGYGSGLLDPIAIPPANAQSQAQWSRPMPDGMTPDDLDRDGASGSGEPDSVRLRLLEALELETREFIEALRERQEAQARRDLLMPISSQPIAPLPTSSLSDPEEWRAYPLGPGDQISIVLQPPFQELSTPAVIAFDGTVFVNLLGQIALDGLTIEESTKILRAGFDEFLVDPEVRVILAAPRPAQVTVSGAVLRPGYFPISPNAFVHEALLTAGGVSVNSDLQNVMIQRRRADGSIISQEVDLYTPIAEGTPLPDIRLRDGDTIVVPERDLLFDSNYDRELLRRTPLVTAQDIPLRLTIIGEVEMPGYYEANSALPYFVEDALILAQGSTNTADLRSVLVQRLLSDGTTIEREVDLYTPLITGETIPELRLEDGDVIVVPKLSLEDIASYNNEILASSNISNPVITVRVFSRALGRISPINLANGSRLTDILNQVPLQDSIVSRIAVVRFDEASGEAVTEHYNGWDAINGDESENILLRDNDVILVGRNAVASISNAVNRFTQPFRDVLGFLLFFDQLQDSADNLFSPNGTNNNNNNRN